MPRPDSSKDGVHTRTRIQQVALELFTERGYEATSLREIAERLGVTKAALYYHFHTKDEIVQSIIDDQVAQLDALIAWGEEQQPTVETRREFVHRYADLLQGGQHVKVMRLFERNQSSMLKRQAGATMRDRMMAVQRLLCAADDAPAQQLRRSLAIMALHTAWFVLREHDINDEERRAAALEVALDLVE
jgi:AcrR family transcriptional regulator